jgi:hypothetical protein
MLAFRSEGEVDRWCAAKGIEPGAVFSPHTLWRLASVWYEDRLRPDWRRRPPDERQRLLDEVGLRGEFWRIEP